MNAAERALFKRISDLLERAYKHLNYCGYGDAWERECSEDLRADLDDFFNESKQWGGGKDGA